jgi:hypothetical protein
MCFDPAGTFKNERRCAGEWSKFGLNGYLS